MKNMFLFSHLNLKEVQITITVVKKGQHCSRGLRLLRVVVIVLSMFSRGADGYPGNTFWRRYSGNTCIKCQIWTAAFIKISFPHPNALRNEPHYTVSSPHAARLLFNEATVSPHTNIKYSKWFQFAVCSTTAAVLHVFQLCDLKETYLIKAKAMKYKYSAPVEQWHSCCRMTDSVWGARPLIEHGDKKGLQHQRAPLLKIYYNMFRARPSDVFCPLWSSTQLTVDTWMCVLFFHLLL